MLLIMSRVLVQPAISIHRPRRRFDEYVDYAIKQDFNFELVDFAIPVHTRAEASRFAKTYASDKRLKGRLTSMHGVFIDLYLNSPDVAIRKVAEDRIIQNLEVAQQLKVKYVVFHTNSLPMINKKEYADGWVTAHAAFWSKMLKKYDCTILLENMWDDSPELLKRVIKTVGSSRLGVCFDIGHANVFSRVPVEVWFSKLGRHMPYLHLNDNDGQHDYEWPPGRGSVDWEGFSRLVQKYCDNPLAVIEVPDLKAIKSSIAYLKKNQVYPFV